MAYCKIIYNLETNYRFQYLISNKNYFQGEYIAPEKIENVYGHSRYISQVFVHGESLKTCLVAIVVPDEKVKFIRFPTFL